MSNQNELQLNVVVEWLMREGYITTEHSKFVFTRKFQEEAFTERGLTIVPSADIMLLPQTKQAWEMKFINLIAEAKVPARLEDTNGGVYYANKFSTEGLKVFEKALKSGVQYDVLVKSVMLYYKSNVRYKKAVGNYFRDGDWRTDYEALLSTAEQGVDALTKHIDQELKPNDGERSHYSLG